MQRMESLRASREEEKALRCTVSTEKRKTLERLLSRVGAGIYLRGLDLGAGGDGARAHDASLGSERRRAGAGKESRLHFVERRKKKSERAEGEREAGENDRVACSPSPPKKNLTSATDLPSFF